MDVEYIEELRKKVKKALKSDKMRFRHSIGVADTCACLAMRYNIDVQKAYISGLLHDCAKCVPDDEKISICSDNNIKLTDIELKNPFLIHAKLGAFYAKEIYRINDEDICMAIETHTTGKKAMSMLQKILFIADYIEPYRDKADNLSRIRELSFFDIDKAVFEVTRDSLEYLNKNNKIIDNTTVETYEYYRKLIQ